MAHEGDRDQLPAPLVSADVDLRGFSGFILDVDRLLASELLALAAPQEFAAAFILWCRAWKQSPPASLPEDDKLLAIFSGAGRNWTKVKAMALRGFIKCRDGRLYHKVLAGQANDAWDKRKKFRERSAKANERRWPRDNSQHEHQSGTASPNGKAKERKNNPNHMPQGLQEGTTQGFQEGLLQGYDKDSLRFPVEGKGREVEGEVEKKKDAASAAAVAAPNGVPNGEGHTTPEIELFRRGKQILGASAGGMVSNLLKSKGGNIALARAAIETASTKQNPREYVAGVIRGQERQQDFDPAL